MEDGDTFYSLSPKGLSILGCLWRVDQFIDLSPIRSKYLDGWRRVQNVKTPAPLRHKAITHILFEILRFLQDTNKIQEADAILNSVSNFKWHSKDNVAKSDMLQSMSQLAPEVKVENRQGLFSLTQDPLGIFHQTWLIDRVMEKGGVWSGTLVEDDMTKAIRGMQPLHTPSTSHGVLLESASMTSSKTVQEPAYEGPSLTDTSKLETRLPESHGSFLFLQSIMSMISEAMDDGSYIEDTKSKMTNNGKPAFDMKPSKTAMSLLLMTFSGRGMGETQALNRRAIFDLDGCSSNGVLVVTPFRPYLEAIPRPVERSLSVSWIVERLDPSDTEEDRLDSEYQKQFKVRGMVRGMWTYLSFPPGRYLLV